MKLIAIVLVSLLSQPIIAKPNIVVHQSPGFPVEELKISIPGKIKPLRALPQPKPLYVAQKPKTHHTGRVGSPSENENIAWSFLVARYTRNQTAGIMGNLRQEHNFQTSGDGIAQWMGGRKARLMAMDNPYSIHTQLNFLVIEMKEMGLVLPNTVEGATIAFQDKFERCGVCMEAQRIRYAHEILARH